MPFDTFSRTSEPFAAFPPAAGSWATTFPISLEEKTWTTLALRPAAASRSRASVSGTPTVFGTVTSVGPFETSSCTCEPSSCSVAGSGALVEDGALGSLVRLADDVGLEAVVLEPRDRVVERQADHRRHRGRVGLGEVPRCGDRGERERKDDQQRGHEIVAPTARGGVLDALCLTA